jgi:hypothetical protein
LTEIDLSSHSPCLSTTVGEVTVKEEEGSLLPSLERLEASVEEDKTGNSFGLVSFQSNSPSQISGSGNRQYYRSSFSEKPGRHSLFQPVFSLQGDSPSLLGTWFFRKTTTVVLSVARTRDLRWRVALK